MKTGLNKIKFLLPFFLFGLFFIAKPTLATVQYSIIQNGSNGNTGNLLLAGQTFNSAFNNIARIEFLASAGCGAGNPITVHLCTGSSTNFATDYNCTGSGMTFLASTTVVCSNNNVYQWNFSPKYTVPNTRAFFSLKTNNNISYVWNTANPYADGAVLPTTLNQNADLYFRIGYDDAYDPAYLKLLSPTFGQRFVDEPVVFTVELYNPQLAYNGGVIEIMNKTTWTALQDIQLDISTTTGVATTEIPYDQFQEVNYRATAYLIDRNTGIKSTSSVVDYVLGSTTVFMGAGDQQYVKGGMLSEAQICGSIATSTFFGAFECAGKKLLYFSFTPNEFALETLKTSYSNFKDQFPFSVYYDLTDTVLQSIASTTLTRNDTFDAVMINKNKEIITLPVLSSSSMPNLIGQTNTELIRDTIGWLIWLAFAFLIYLTYKRI